MNCLISAKRVPSRPRKIKTGFKPSRSAKKSYREDLNNRASLAAADIFAGAKMHGSAAHRAEHMEVPDDIPAGAGMHGGAARRGGHMDVPSEFSAVRH